MNGLHYSIRIFCIFFLFINSVYAQSPTSFSKKVVGLPSLYLEPNQDLEINIKQKKTTLPWIVFSDRSDNYSTTSPGGSLMMEKFGFMQPFYVAEERDGYLKLLLYKDNMVKGLNLKNKKDAESVGWIAKDRLLLWQRSFVDPSIRFSSKTLTIINSAEPLINGQYYFDSKDSIYVFDGPDLKNVKGKIGLHSYVYVYKTTSDGKQYLIGTSDQFVPKESAKHVKGWVSSAVARSWGQRLYFTPFVYNEERVDSIKLKINKHKIIGAEGYTVDPLIDTNNIALQGLPIISVDKSRINSVHGIDVYNKKNNKLLTINGSELTYPGFVKLIKSRSKINVIFVLDGGSGMLNHFSSLTNTIQSFENLISNHFNASNVKYGSVVYRNTNTCDVGNSNLELTGDYRKLMSFLKEEIQKTATCAGGISTQPLFTGIEEATQLVRNVPQETNLFVVIGSTGDNDGISNSSISSLARKVADVEGRLLMLQMLNSKGRLYDNFIVQSRKLVSSEAYYAAERRKFQLVRGEVFGDQNYDFNLTDSISYYLDFPHNSLIQGGVVFPSRGSSLNTRHINSAFTRFLSETKMDIRNHINSLDSAFRTTGLSNANINPALQHLLGSAFVKEVGEKMPHNNFKFASELVLYSDIQYELTKPNGIDFSLVLNQSEYHDLLNSLSILTGDNLQLDDRLIRKNLFTNYISLYTKKWPMYSAKSVQNWTIGKYLSVIMGIPVLHNESIDKSVKSLKDNKGMSLSEFEKYIACLKEVTSKIRRYAQEEGKFYSNGEVYYVIKGNSFDLLTK